jgi:replication-associated recombination protein RarA
MSSQSTAAAAVTTAPMLSPASSGAAGDAAPPTDQPTSAKNVELVRNNDAVNSPAAFQESITRDEPREYDAYELLSAMQKAVRRGLEDDAMYFGTQLYSQSNSDAGRAFRRLVIIASEDIGLADPQAVLLIHSLYSQWKAMPKDKRSDHEDKIKGEGRLYFVHALLSAVRAKKSRLINHILICHFYGERDGRDVPDYALDMHTTRGKSRDRGVDHFFEEGATLANEDTTLGDVHKAKAWLIYKRKKGE